MKLNKVTPLPFEIFESLALAKTKEDKIQILRQNQGFELNTILMMAFDPKIVLALPSGSPPYEKDDGDPTESMNRIATVLREIPLLLVSDKRLDPIRKETKFIGILESINFRDAEVLIAAKDKNLEKICPGLTRELVQEAIPGLLR